MFLRQLIDPLGNEGAVDRVDAGPATRRGVGGLKPDQRLQERRAVDGVERRLQEAVPHVAVGVKEDSIAFPIRSCACQKALSRGDGLAVFAHVFGHRRKRT